LIQLHQKQIMKLITIILINIDTGVQQHELGSKQGKTKHNHYYLLN